MDFKFRTSRRTEEVVSVTGLRRKEGRESIKTYDHLRGGGGLGENYLERKNGGGCNYQKALQG